MSDKAKGEVEQGQQFNPNNRVPYPFTKQEMPTEDAALLVGSDFIEITPVNKDISSVVTFTVAAIQSAYDAEVTKMGVLVTLPELPDELLSITVTGQKVSGAGQSSHPKTQQAFQFDGAGGGSFNPRASAQGSGSVMLDVTPKIRRRNNSKIPGVLYAFFMDTSYTHADVLTRLATAALANATVLAFPNFKPESDVIVCYGQNIALQMEASSTVSVSDSTTAGAWSYDWGNGFSYDVGTNSRVTVIPPCIHGAISIAVPTGMNFVTASVQVDASTLQVGTTHYSIGEIGNTLGPTDLTALATISTASLAATSPSAIPTSGLYLVSLDQQIVDFDRVAVNAIVVDFSYFA